MVFSFPLIPFMFLIAVDDKSLRRDVSILSSNHKKWAVYSSLRGRREELSICLMDSSIAVVLFLEASYTNK